MRAQALEELLVEAWQQGVVRFWCGESWAVWKQVGGCVGLIQMGQAWG